MFPSSGGNFSANYSRHNGQLIPLGFRRDGVLTHRLRRLGIALVPLIRVVYSYP